MLTVELVFFWFYLLLYLLGFLLYSAGDIFYISLFLFILSFESVLHVRNLSLQINLFIIRKHCASCIDFYLFAEFLDDFLFAVNYRLISIWAINQIHFQLLNFNYFFYMRSYNQISCPSTFCPSPKFVTYTYLLLQIPWKCLPIICFLNLIIKLDKMA